VSDPVTLTQLKDAANAYKRAPGDADEGRYPWPDVEGRYRELLRLSVRAGLPSPPAPEPHWGVPSERHRGVPSWDWLRALENWFIEAEVRLAEGGGGRPAKRKIGRPKKTEKDSATLVVAALNKWHGYDSVTNFDPATNRVLAEKYGVSPNALSRFLKDRFPEEEKPGKKYKAACRNKTIIDYLKLWNRDLPDRNAAILPHESGRRDED
jgi:hypothetical protein